MRVFIPYLQSRVTRAAILALWPFVTASQAGAQGVAVSRATRIRVDYGAEVTGAYVGLRGDSLMVVADHQRDSIGIALSSVERVAISRGRHGHAVKGLEFGLYLGVLSGMIVSAVVGAPQQPRQGGPFSNIDGVTQTAILGVFGAVVGGTVGGIGGALYRTERWETIANPRFAPSFSRAPPRGTVIGVRLVGSIF